MVDTPPVAATVPETVSLPEEVNVPVEDWHAEAGRKGARRVHQLIQEGKLYEKEHGLKSGRQRLRQLIELGKLYEEEHSLRPPRRVRRNRARISNEELFHQLFDVLLRLAKPSLRGRLLQLLNDVEARRKAG
jgi:hypothetical protein